MNDEKFIEMVEKFQCPGCVCGSDTTCGKYEVDYKMCGGHVLGTSIGIGNSFALGLPTGFNKPGFDEKDNSLNRMRIRLHPKESDISYLWDDLNIPVWAMVEDGYLFVRTYSPRINVGQVDIIEGGTLDMVKGAIDVSKFKDKID